MEIGSPNLMKAMNLNNVRRLMRQLEYATKPELATLSGLSVVTINSLMNELISRKEVLTSQIAPSTGGRPATRYQYNVTYCLSLILTIHEKNNVDQVTAKVINLTGQEIYHDVQQNEHMNIDVLFNMIDVILLKYPQIEVIGIAIPGQIVDGEIKVGSHDLLIGLRLGDMIEEKYHKDVIFENDVNAAVLGYCSRNVTGSSESLVGLYFPRNSPPGAGIHLNGQIIKGKHGMAGEIKYLRSIEEWRNYMTVNEIYENIYQTIHAFVSTLAPDDIVIFREDMNKEAFVLGWEKYALSYQLPVLPTISFESYLDDDILLGMKKWTLNHLDKKFLDGEIGQPEKK